MSYGFNSFSTILVIVLLVNLSIEDCRIQRIENWEMIPSLIVGIITSLFKMISSDLLIRIQTWLYFVVGFGLGVFLYSSGLFGGADFKILLILLMVIEPTSSYGITSNLDGIQFFYYLLISILIFLLLRLVSNVRMTSKTGYRNQNDLNFWEFLFLCISCRFQRIEKITCKERIQLKLGVKEIIFHNSISLELGVYCWSNTLTPIFPFITVSLILAIFT